MDRDTYEYALRAYEEDKRKAAADRRIALEKKYIQKQYVGNSAMVTSAHAVDQEHKNQELQKLNARDAAILSELHFGKKGLDGAAKELRSSTPKQRLTDKWVSHTNDEPQRSSLNDNVPTDKQSTSAAPPSTREALSERFGVVNDPGSSSTNKPVEVHREFSKSTPSSPSTKQIEPDR